MKKEKTCAHREIRYSCVTGEAVWIYCGASNEACRRAYYRTVLLERRRRQQWPGIIRRRTSGITRLLQECLATLPILGTLTAGQREAIKTIRQMIDHLPAFCSPFLEHDRERRHQIHLEKRRRIYWKDAEYRMREKERKRKSRLGIS